MLRGEPPGPLYRLDLWRIEGRGSPVGGECPDPKALPRDPMAEGSMSGMYGISDRYRNDDYSPHSSPAAISTEAPGSSDPDLSPVSDVNSDFVDLLDEFAELSSHWPGYGPESFCLCKCLSILEQVQDEGTGIIKHSNLVGMLQWLRPCYQKARVRERGAGQVSEGGDDDDEGGPEDDADSILLSDATQALQFVLEENGRHIPPDLLGLILDSLSICLVRSRIRDACDTDDEEPEIVGESRTPPKKRSRDSGT